MNTACKHAALFLIVLSQVHTPVALAQWTQVTPSAPWGARTDFGCAVFEDKIWVIGGGGPKGLHSDIWSSVDGLDWTSVTLSVPWGGRFNHAAVVFENQLWVIGGDSKSIWKSANGKDWTAAGDLPWYSYSSTKAAVFQNRLWVFSGAYSNSPPNGPQWYIGSSSDGATWQFAPDHPWMLYSGLSVFVFDSKLWYGGGSMVYWDEMAGRGTEVYESALSASENGGHWMASGCLSPARKNFAAVATQDRIWIMGGRGQDGLLLGDMRTSLKGINWYNVPPPAEVWTPREGLSAVVFKGSIFVLGGHAVNVYFNDVWRYDIPPDLPPDPTPTPPPATPTPELPPLKAKGWESYR